MRIGLLARADDRGLGNQTRLLYQYLRPERTVVIDMAHLSPYPMHLDWYPDRFAVWSALPDGSWRTSDAELEAFLDGLDVVLTAETPYDYRLYDVARRMGVRTAVQANFEFYRGLEPNLPRPDMTILPSRWNLNRVPNAVYLPLPIDRNKCAFRQRTSARTFLHVAGHRTNLDRNGTRIVMEAAGYCNEPVRIIIRSQSPLGWDHWMGRPSIARVDIYSDDHPVENYWDLYDEGDVLLLPRKFGGQSLQMNEALSCGLPVIMPNMSPQSGFLPSECLTPMGARYETNMQSGPVEVCETEPRVLAGYIDRFARNDALVSSLSTWANEWADQHSWDALLPKWIDTLEKLVGAGVH